MSRPETRWPAALVLFLAAFVLGSGVAIAQPPGPPPLPISELTAEQFRTLPDSQVIRADEMEISLGELRAREAERRVASEAAIAAGAETVRARLDTLQQERARREVAQAQAARQQVEALMAHFERLAAVNPELVSRAETRSAQQRQLRQLFVESSRAATTTERRRIERKLTTLERSGTPPGP